MDWEPWLDEGFVRPIDWGGREQSLERVRKAWAGVIDARAAYLRNDWSETDQRLRSAFIVGVDALLLREELEPVRDFDLEISQRLTREFFDEGMIDGIYERARILRNMLPLGPVLPDTQLRLIRRSVAASSEFVALIEGHCFL